MGKTVGMYLSLLLVLVVLFQASESAEKVRLELYYESLCPYCSAFIVNGLSPMFSNGLIDIVELKLYPWGNAKIQPNSSIACQHGPLECLLNIVEACAIHAYPALSDHFPIIECVERLVQARNYTQWESCFPILSNSVLHDCTAGSLGNQLVLKYGAATGALKPPHQYVPWVVVNGQPLYDEYENFTSYICKAYKGTPPTACSSESSSSHLREKTLNLPPVCYADMPPRKIDTEVM